MQMFTSGERVESPTGTVISSNESALNGMLRAHRTLAQQCDGKIPLLCTSACREAMTSAAQSSLDTADGSPVLQRSLLSLH
eukprot:4871482-Amphidinium_carterae.2